MWEYCAGSLEGLCGGVADILLQGYVQEVDILVIKLGKH